MADCHETVHSDRQTNGFLSIFDVFPTKWHRFEQLTSQKFCSMLSSWLRFTSGHCITCCLSVADLAMGGPGGCSPLTKLGAGHRSWLCEAVYLRHRVEFSFKSLTFGPFCVWKWTKKTFSFGGLHPQIPHHAPGPCWPQFRLMLHRCTCSSWFAPLWQILDLPLLFIKYKAVPSLWTKEQHCGLFSDKAISIATV